MKIFFSMRHSGAIRNFESVLRALTERGHEIHLSFVMKDKIGDDRIVPALVKDHPSITYSLLPKRPEVRWFEFVRALRFTIDLLRYRLPMYADAHALRERIEKRVAPLPRLLTRLPFLRWRPINWMAVRTLMLLERAIPVDPFIEADVLSRSPDLLLVTPLVDLGSDQVDYIKTAKKHGLRSALGVHSWDNLTNKGLIRILPDRVYVWNELQRTEAVDHHGMEPDHVVVTGASSYDHWFDWKPSREMAEFKEEVGLDPEEPYLLYLCSSPFIAPTEIDFIERWISAIRDSDDPALQRIGLLVRPHPENRQAWHRRVPVENVAIWPSQGANPVNRDSRCDYYDSIFHCRGVVAINTTAMIESGIIGRQVFTVQPPEFEGTQSGTLHFRYLSSVGGGLVRGADDLDAHIEQLQEFLKDGTEAGAAGLEFVRQFVRPHGLSTPATDLYVEQIEAQQAQPPPAPESSLALFPLRLAFMPLAYFMHWKHGVIKRRRKAERAAKRGGVATQMLGSPRETALKLLSWFLRGRRVRAFLNAYVIPRIARDQMAFKEMAMAERQIQRLARSPKDKIIVGPWLSEVGFELLYWIPFLKWVTTYRHFDPERLVVVSRGGAASWYKTLTDNYLDILDFMTPQDYLRANEERMQSGKQKQRAISDFDRDILRIAKQVLKQKDAEILHPSTMYNLFMPYWKRRATVSLIERFAEFSKFAELDCSDIVDRLPENYIAVRFYFNDSFPDTKQNRVFIAQLLSRLTQRHDVVLLNPGFAMDDQRDFRPADLDRVHTIEDLMTPSTNLEVQTKVISRADAFFGTYGGLSYLPPFYGVDSLAFYSHRQGFLYHHFELANRVFMSLNEAAFIPLDVRDADLINKLTGDDFFSIAPPRGRLDQTVLVGSRSRDTKETKQPQPQQEVSDSLAREA